MKKIKEMFQSKNSRNGVYSAGLVCIVIAIVVVINLIAGQMPDSLKNIDLSDTHIYDISDTSTDMLKDLDKDIQFQVITELDSMDSRIETFVKKYAKLSDHIQVKWTDSVQHPAVLQEYDTDGDIIVVSCEETGKSTTIAFSDIIQYDYSSYYTTGQMTESAFDGEGQLTSAVNYVASETESMIYRTSGHGEDTISSSVSELLTKNNISTKELNLSMNPEIPEDCQLLMLNAPTSDITDEELSLITDYMENGGKVYLILGNTTKETPNLDSLMKSYGLEKVDGYIADMERCYQGNYYAIFPVLSLSGDLGNGIDNKMVLMLNSFGMQKVDTEDESVTVSAFMNSSSNSCAVTEDSEEKGAYVLGAVATKDESKLTVLASGSLIDSQVTGAFANLDNLTLFMNTVTANFDDVENLAIESKSLSATYNTPLHTGSISMVTIFVVPLAILVLGFVVWMRRRKA